MVAHQHRIKEALLDILLDRATHDIAFTPKGDIRLENSVAQKIKIRLLWFLDEWRWAEDGTGLPYFDELFIKNPDTDMFESLIREQIFDVDEVTDVPSVSVTYDAQTRTGVISFTAETDYETIQEEVTVDGK